MRNTDLELIARAPASTLMFNMDEVLLREPNLWLPRQKPVGLVKVDRANPQAHKLRSMFLLNGKNVHDAAGLVPRSAIIVAGSALKESATVEGSSLLFDRTPSNEVTIEDVGEPWAFATAGGWSVAYHLIWRGVVDANEYDFSTAGANNLGSTLGFDVPYTMVVGVPYSILISVNPSTDTCYAFLNGAQIGQKIGSGFGNKYSHQIRYDADSYQIDMGLGSSVPVTGFKIGGTDQKESDRFDGDFLSCTTWHRAITKEEGISLTRDPYQVLVPA
jgi:hypothetical protein